VLGGSGLELSFMWNDNNFFCAVVVQIARSLLHLSS